MPSPLSVDLRQRVVAFVSAGASCREAAARFGVSAASVSRWTARVRQDGHVAPPQPFHPLRGWNLGLLRPSRWGVTATRIASRRSLA